MRRGGDRGRGGGGGVAWPLAFWGMWEGGGGGSAGTQAGSGVSDCEAGRPRVWHTRVLRREGDGGAAGGRQTGWRGVAGRLWSWWRGGGAPKRRAAAGCNPRCRRATKPAGTRRGRRSGHPRQGPPSCKVGAQRWLAGSRASPPPPYQPLGTKAPQPLTPDQP